MTAGRLGPFVTPLFLGLVLLVFHPGADAWFRGRSSAARDQPAMPGGGCPLGQALRAATDGPQPPLLGPEGGKAGVCPELENDDVNCTQECSSDEECGDYLKCCKAGCASVCYRPDEKPGSCPRVDLPLTPLGICRDQCQVDSQCPERMKCCRNGCGKVSCVTPVF
ncbi:WAP four-disulfide core domain protein 2 [Phyllostomus discolor]|uniref:WAP four-disulfide core domain protein 2 n=1 Tax=Phyllostomus discolor TaxID=89673 RepID=A0A7E6CFR9_9CHIR|nr:WAP four-disulfide core domain protein 2 [Phyllostomus discolor]